jgi:ABC-type polysaccharide/polyol phosphate export permease
LLTDLYQRRALIWAFANRDFATRYRSSVLGWFWSLLQPLATLLVFAVVFSVVFRIMPPPLGADPDRGSYAAFLFTGLVTWNLFYTIVVLSMSQLKSNGELLRKVQFPGWAPVLGASIVQLVQVALEVIVLVLMFFWQRNVGWTWILAIPILIALALFAQGIGLMLSILNARFGDVQYIVTVVLGALYFLTPVIYPMSMVEETASNLVIFIQANPLTWFVEAMHDAMYSLIAPEWWVVPGLILLGATTFIAGLAVFNRSSEDIGELL